MNSKTPKKKTATVPDALASKAIGAALDSMTWKFEALRVSGPLLAAESSAFSQVGKVLENSSVFGVGKELENLAVAQGSAFSQLAKAFEESRLAAMWSKVDTSLLEQVSKTAESALQSVGIQLQSVGIQLQVLDSLSVYRNAFSNVALNFTALTALDVFPTASAIAAVCDKVRQFAEVTNFTTEQIDNLRGSDIRVSASTLALMKPLDITDHLTDFENVTIGWASASKGQEIIRLREELAQAKRKEKQLERKIEELEEAQQAKPLDENERMFG